MRRRAFTLLEVILCLGIVAALCGSVLGFLLNMLSTREVIAEASARQQGAGALLEHIESDLAGGMVGDERSGAGIVGTSSSLVLLTRGVWMPERSRAQGVMGDLQGSEYAFDATEGVVRARRWSGGDDEAPEAEVICGGLQSARFRYFDGENWSGSFDSVRRGQLPVAVELAIWFGEPERATEETSRGGAAGAGAREAGAGRSEFPLREPDRVRLMIVPDGPVTSWMEAR